MLLQRQRACLSLPSKPVRSERRKGECLGPSGRASEKIGAHARLRKNSADAHAGPLLPLWTGFAARSPPQLKERPGGHFSTRLPACVGPRRAPLHLEHPTHPNMGGLSGATIAEADKDSSNAVVYKVGMARMMETIRKLDERDADYAVLRAIESTRRGSAVQFVVESDGVPPLREIVEDQEPEDIGRVPVAVVRRAQQKWAEARLATDDRAIFVHEVDTLLHIPGNENFDFAGAGTTSAPPRPDRRPCATSSRPTQTTTGRRASSSCATRTCCTASPSRSRRRSSRATWPSPSRSATWRRTTTRWRSHGRGVREEARP